MIYLAGIDTLVVGFYISKFMLTDEEWQYLTDAKESAKSTIFKSSGCLIKFQGLDFTMRASGQNPYTFVLQSSDFTFKIAPKIMNHSFPEVYVELRSQFLWRLSYKECFRYLKEWLSTWAQIKSDMVSRADLCVDLRGFPNIKKEEIISRVRKMKNYEAPDVGEGEVNYLGSRITGWQFGSHALMLRIYNKSLEVVKSRKAWFHDLWKRGGWDGKCDVTRVEFQLGRVFLREFDVTSFESFEERSGDIYRYLTMEWFTVRIPDYDLNKSRWSITTFWCEVQGAVPRFGEIWGQTRGKIREGRGYHLMPQAVGVITTILASRENYTLAQFYIEMVLYLRKKKGLTLEEAIEEKRRRHSLFEDCFEPF